MKTRKWQIQFTITDKAKYGGIDNIQPYTIKELKKQVKNLDIPLGDVSNIKVKPLK